ncbi:MAG: XisI protein [Bacteroidia bacterium]|nr:XisI protein [Bacteroidia bacterium]
MDKTLKYQQIICDLLQEYAGIKKSLTPNVRSHLVLDKENRHYQLISMGWHGSKYIYTVAFHFSIMDGKVWIQQNNTDIMIADELSERGIPSSDIILGFVPEKMRNI